MEIAAERNKGIEEAARFLRYKAFDEFYANEIAEGRFEEFQKKHLLKARHDYTDASLEAIKNRETLKQLMETHGFESIPHEWWHYNLKGWQNYPVVEWKTE